MRFFVSLFVFLLMFGVLSAQQTTLSGQVSIHNSKYTTGKIKRVANVYISAPFTKPANTDQQGQFNLEFVGLDPGTSVKVQAEKNGLEVVNQYDLNHVIIARKAPLRIFLIEKGKLALAQTELYNISKEALFKNKNALIARLRGEQDESKKAIAELEAFFGYPIANRFEAEQALIAQIESLEKRLPEYAQQLAKQNLDFASQRYIDAFNLYKLGDILGSLALLNNAALEESYEQIKSNKKSILQLEAVVTNIKEDTQLQLDQLVASYTLKANNHSLLFNYNKVAESYLKIIALYNENPEFFNPEEAIDAYNNVGLNYLYSGESNKALEYFNSALLQAKNSAVQDAELAYLYNNIGLAYRDLGEYKQQLKYLQAALKRYLLQKNTKRKEVFTSYNNLGVALMDLGEYSESLESLNKAIAYYEQEQDHLSPSSLADSFNNIALVYGAMADFESALTYLQRAVAIDEQLLERDHPNLAISYANLGLAYRNVGKLNEALNYLEKAISIQENSQEINLPALAISYSNIGYVYLDLLKHEKGISYFKKSIAIKQEVMGADHPSLATTYGNLAMAYREKNDFESAIEFLNKSLAIQKKQLDPGHFSIGLTYYNFAQVYKDSGENELALAYILKALAIEEAVFGSSHPNVLGDKLTAAELYVLLEKPREARPYIKQIKNSLKALADQELPALRERLNELEEKKE